MSFSNVAGRYYQKESNEYPKSISYPQRLVLHGGPRVPTGPIMLPGFTHPLRFKSLLKVSVEAISQQPTRH